jgi:hypothetical protein
MTLASKHRICFPANAPAQLDDLTRKLAHIDSWTRLRAVAALIMSWGRPDEQVSVEECQPPADVEGREIRAVPTEFIGAAERRAKDVPAHLTDGVRLIERDGITRERLMTATAARALAAELVAAADQVDPR